MTEKEFCEIYSSFTGEEIDNIKQLHMHRFNGEELLEFAEHVIKSIADKKHILCDVCGTKFTRIAVAGCCSEKCFNVKNFKTK